MVGDASTAAVRPDITALLNGQLALLLTTAQIQYLAERHGLDRPVGFKSTRLDSGNVSNVASELSALRVVEDGVPAEWFMSLWRTITAPTFVVVLERVVENETFVWVYSIDRMTFSEQVETPSGAAWLFGSHAELLPRILLNLGLMRFASGMDPLVHDPLAWATSWSSSVEMLGPDIPGQTRIERRTANAFDSESWQLATPPGMEKSNARDVALAVAAVLGASEENP